MILTYSRKIDHGFQHEASTSSDPGLTRPLSNIIRSTNGTQRRDVKDDCSWFPINESSTSRAIRSSIRRLVVERTRFLKGQDLLGVTSIPDSSAIYSITALGLQLHTGRFVRLCLVMAI